MPLFKATSTTNEDTNSLASLRTHRKSTCQATLFKIAPATVAPYAFTSSCFLENMRIMFISLGISGLCVCVCMCKTVCVSGHSRNLLCRVHGQRKICRHIFTHLYTHLYIYIYIVCYTYVFKARDAVIFSCMYVFLYMYEYVSTPIKIDLPHRGFQNIYCKINKNAA